MPADDVRAAIALTAAGGESAHPGSTERLMEYWTHGEGAAKINWAAPCGFCRCLDHLSKYLNGGREEAKGLCNHLEQRATGHAPNPEHSRTKHCPC